MSTIVCTLFEGSYHHGLCALINSLLRVGCTCDFYIGFRGALPKWLDHPPIQQQGDFRYQLGSNQILHFIPLETSWHLTNYKPLFMQSVLNEFAPQARRIMYFDPDITVRASWTFLESWVDNGVALCEDVNNRMPWTHPKRIAWRRLFVSDQTTTAICDSYVNAGFIGLTRENELLLTLWSDIIERASNYTGGPDKWYPASAHNPESLFSAFDQDALNIALMCKTFPVSIVGPEGMDFYPGGYIMSHAIGMNKPWHFGMVGRALRGRRPSLADSQFARNCNGPINSMTLASRLLLYADLWAAKIIGRILS